MKCLFGGKQLSDKITITYETLFDLLRKEKNRSELQPLNSDFYSEVIKYLSEKIEILKDIEKKQDVLGFNERSKTMNQIENIKKMVNELYERREQKIIKLAMNKSKTKSDEIGSANLLSEESQLSSALVSLLDAYRSGVLYNVLSLKSPTIAERIEEKKLQTNQFPNDPVQTSLVSEKSGLINASSSLSTEENIFSAEAGVLRVLITNPIDAFVGPDFETIGPFSPDEEAELPKQIAEILISRGDAAKM